MQKTLTIFLYSITYLCLYDKCYLHFHHSCKLSLCTVKFFLMKKFAMMNILLEFQVEQLTTSDEYAIMECVIGEMIRIYAK